MKPQYNNTINKDYREVENESFNFQYSTNQEKTVVENSGKLNNLLQY